MKCEPPVVFNRTARCLMLETYKVQFCLYARGFLRVVKRGKHYDQAIAEATREQWEKELWDVFGESYWNGDPTLYQHIASTVHNFEVVK